MIVDILNEFLKGSMSFAHEKNSVNFFESYYWYYETKYFIYTKKGPLFSNPYPEFNSVGF